MAENSRVRYFREVVVPSNSGSKWKEGHINTGKGVIDAIVFRALCSLLCSGQPPLTYNATGTYRISFISD